MKTETIIRFSFLLAYFEETFFVDTKSLRSIGLHSKGNGRHVISLARLGDRNGLSTINQNRLKCDAFKKPGAKDRHCNKNI